MNKDEIDVQIALGTFVTAPAEIAKIVRKSEDPKVAVWASRHSSARVRAAAAKSKFLPIIDFVYLALFDDCLTVRREINAVIDNRKHELLLVWYFIVDMPQTKLPFDDDEKFIKKYYKSIS